MKKRSVGATAVLVVVLLAMLAGCEAFLDPLEAPADLQVSAEDGLSGNAWEAEGLLSPTTDGTLADDPVVEWSTLLSEAPNDPNVFYKLHLGSVDADGAYIVDYYVPYLEATSFDLSRLPLESGREYYVGVTGRMSYTWVDDDSDGILDGAVPLPSDEFDLSEGVFADTWLSNDLGGGITFISNWFDLFPVPFTYTGPSTAYAAVPTAVTADDSSWESDGSVTVSWTDPADAGLLEIRVTQFPGPAAPFTVVPGAGQISLSGISSRLAYVVWVQAVATDGRVSEPAVVSFSPGDATVAQDGSSANSPSYRLSTPDRLVPASYNVSMIERIGLESDGALGGDTSRKQRVRKYFTLDSAGGIIVGEGIFDAWQ